ncbi:MAG: 2Fe-2S iron-sulfur cluster-binding protein, partial [Verrucomicrobiaceae bacterium]
MEDFLSNEYSWISRSHLLSYGSILSPFWQDSAHQFTPIDTVEGMTESGALDDLRAAFITHNAAQCAFCSSGMLLAAHELVQSGEMLTRDEIR